MQNFAKTGRDAQFDINKLAYAVAMAETQDCTKGLGKKYFNCFGIRHNGKDMQYKSKKDSYDEFKRVWQKFYGGFPTYQQAVIWTGNSAPESWLVAVKQFYYGK